MERIELVVADITTLDVDVVVTAANAGLRGGSGVDGAVHRAAGPRLLAHCRELGGCPTGEAVRTPAFDLESRGVKWIVHAVGPVWGTDPHADGTEGLGYRLEDVQLAQCYQRALELAAEVEARSIAFPAISTGVYGFPRERAVKIAVGHARFHVERRPLPERIVLCCFSEADAQLYRQTLTPRDFTSPIQIGGLDPSQRYKR